MDLLKERIKNMKIIKIKKTNNFFRGFIIGWIFVELFFSCDHTHYKCLEDEWCRNEGEIRRYPKHSDECPECLECINGIWQEIDCEDFNIEDEECK